MSNTAVGMILSQCFAPTNNHGLTINTNFTPVLLFFAMGYRDLQLIFFVLFVHNSAKLTKRELTKLLLMSQTHFSIIKGAITVDTTMKKAKQKGKLFSIDMPIFLTMPLLYRVVAPPISDL